MVMVINPEFPCFPCVYDQTLCTRYSLRFIPKKYYELSLFIDMHSTPVWAHFMLLSFIFISFISKEIVDANWALLRLKTTNVA